MKKYYCYLIYSSKIQRTYIGITNDLQKRIQQHNGMIKGGAKSTRCDKNWKYFMIISQFINKSDACRFEWYWKHDKNLKNKWINTKPLIKNKLKRLIMLLIQDEWHHLSILSNSTSYSCNMNK